MVLCSNNRHLEKSKPLTWMLNLEPVLGQLYKQPKVYNKEEKKSLRVNAFFFQMRTDLRLFSSWMFGFCFFFYFPRIMKVHLDHNYKQLLCVTSPFIHRNSWTKYVCPLALLVERGFYSDCLLAGVYMACSMVVTTKYFPVHSGMRAGKEWSVFCWRRKSHAGLF